MTSPTSCPSAAGCHATLINYDHTRCALALRGNNAVETRHDDCMTYMLQLSSVFVHTMGSAFHYRSLIKRIKFPVVLPTMNDEKSATRLNVVLMSDIEGKSMTATSRPTRRDVGHTLSERLKCRTARDMPYSVTCTQLHCT